MKKLQIVTSVNQNEDAPWEKRKEITITGTENYCSSVNVEILDGEEIIYTGTASVKNNKWSITAVPELEADEVGRNLTVRVTDPLDNSSTQEFLVKKVDIVAPEPVEESIVIGGDWAKEKRYTFRATDSGVGNVSIAFNDLGEYGVASIKITNNNTPAKISVDGTKLTGLPMGKYYAKETIVPTGYMPDTKVYDYTFSYRDMNTKVIEVAGTVTNTVEKSTF